MKEQSLSLTEQLLQQQLAELQRISQLLILLIDALDNGDMQNDHRVTRYLDGTDA